MQRIPEENSIDFPKTSQEKLLMKDLSGRLKRQKTLWNL